MAEDGRVAVRNIRRDARKHLEAAEKAGGDLGRRARAGREGAREDHPRARREDRQGARPQRARTARGVRGARRRLTMSRRARGTRTVEGREPTVESVQIVGDEAPRRCCASPPPTPIFRTGQSRPRARCRTCSPTPTKKISTCGSPCLRNRRRGATIEAFSPTSTSTISACSPKGRNSLRPPTIPPMRPILRRERMRFSRASTSRRHRHASRR